jgi:hypothetical protein
MIAALTCLAQTRIGNTPNNLDLPNPIPVQSYAAVDISSTTVTMIALDDSNNVAYAFPSTSGSQLDVYTWANGTATAAAPLNLIAIAEEVLNDPSDSGTVDMTYSPTLLLSNGQVYGSRTGYFEDPDGETDYDDPVDGGGFTATGNSVTKIDMPPPFNIGLPESAVQGLGIGSASDSGFAGGASEYYDTQSYSYYGVGYVCESGTFFVFDPESDDGTTSTNQVQIEHGTSFDPGPLSNNGWAAGWNSQYPPAAEVWTGGTASPTSLAPMAYPFAINGAGEVVGVDSTRATGYLWTSGSGTQAISQFIPTAFQSEVADISPISISGTNANGNVSILFNAQYKTVPDAGAPPSLSGSASGWAPGTFLLTLTSGTDPIISGTAPGTSGTNSLQQVSLPPNYCTNFPPGAFSGILNAQGLIAAIGTTPTTSGTDAVLLCPVALSCPQADTTGTFPAGYGGIPPDTNPAYFNKANPPDPTLSQSHEPALVIFYKDVINSSFTVQPFTVSLSFGGLSSVTWTQSNGPTSSGTLQNTSSANPQFVDTNVGGLYQFDGTVDSTTVRTSLILPLAGAEIEAVVSADMTNADAFATKVLAKYNPIQIQLKSNEQRWFWLNGAGDYQGRPDNANSKTCARFNPVNDSTGFGAVATWFGVPVRVAKASNFLVGYASYKIGVWNISSWYSQRFGTKNDASATASYNFGWDVAAGTKTYSTDTVTMLESIFYEADIKNTRLWPNTVLPDNLVSRALFTDPNTQFVHPGFTEMTNP